jgi:hypothetical protein
MTADLDAEENPGVPHATAGLAISQATALDELRAAADPAPAAGRPRSRLRLVPWALAGVLVIQAALSLRLIWYNTAFEDEALYLWAGHMEWAHWLHGAPVQPFQAWFSGAPVLYPPLVPVVDAADAEQALPGRPVYLAAADRVLGGVPVLHVLGRAAGHRAVPDARDALVLPAAGLLA